MFGETELSPPLENISPQSPSSKINAENVITLQWRFTHKKAYGYLKPVVHILKCYKLCIWQLAPKNHRKIVDLGEKMLFTDTETLSKDSSCSSLKISRHVSHTI